MVSFQTMMPDLLAMNMVLMTILWIVIAFAVVIGLIMFFLFIRYFNLWLRGYVTRAGISPFSLIFMSLRKVNPQTIVEAKISAVQAGLSNISTQALGAHLLAGGNVTKVVRALIAAHRARIPLDWDTAAAIDLAYVACGRLDLFWEFALNPWDMAAGVLLITEAGGLVGNFSGDADFLHQRECLAGNPRIYGQMVQVLGKYSKFASTADKMALNAGVQTPPDDAAPI